jgi:phenylacetate-CoA ligase
MPPHESDLTDAGGRTLPGGRPASPPLTPLDGWVAARAAGAVGPGRPLPAAARDGLSMPPGAWLPPVLAAAGPRRSAPHALRSHQLAALRETIAHAKAHSPFYAERLRAVGVYDLRSLDDLAALPFTTADDLRAQGARLRCVPAGDVERIVTLPTSGTSGEPKRIDFSAADQELTVEFFRCGMSVFTGQRDRVLILLPGERPGSVGELLARGLEQIGATPLPYGPVSDVDDALDRLEGEQASVVVGIPVQLLALARRSVAQGRRLHVRSVLLSTDHLPRPVVTAIELAWDCRVYNHYGTTEMGLGGAVDCAAHAGLHVREADLLFEIVDPAGGAPVAAGEEGEIVFTTLTREAMPLVRYRTGDLGRFAVEPCPCGSSLRLLAPVRERLDDVATLAGGERLSLADLDDALFALDEVLDFRARLSVNGTEETLTVELLCEGGCAAARRRRAAAALAALPAVAAATAAARLRVEVAAAAPWAGSDGAHKRMLIDERSQETP